MLSVSVLFWHHHVDCAIKLACLLTDCFNCAPQAPFTKPPSAPANVVRIMSSVCFSHHHGPPTRCVSSLLQALSCCGTLVVPTSQPRPPTASISVSTARTSLTSHARSGVVERCLVATAVKGAGPVLGVGDALPWLRMCCWSVGSRK